MARKPYPPGEYDLQLKRAEELKKSGRKGSGLWNKLAREFDYRWTPITILQICHKLGKYKKIIEKNNDT